MPNQDNTSELRDKLRSLKRPTREDFRYPIEAYEDDLVQLITIHTNKAIADVLDRLNHQAINGTDGKPITVPVGDGSPFKVYALPLSSIQAERQKLTNKEVK